MKRKFLFKSFSYKSRKMLVVYGLVLFLVIGLGVFLFTKNDHKNPIVPAKTTDSNTQPQPTETENKPAPVVPKPTPITEPSSTPASTPISDPSSLTAIVNKKRPLSASYVPPNLTSVAGGTVRAEAATSLSQLLNDAVAAGVGMKILSSYRSYANQQSTYNGWVARDGVALADTYSARPGYSEHQTGLAIDLGNGTCDLETCFGNTAAGIWLKNNATKYGFVVRYLEDKTSVTGYQYEPWHIRYIGTDVSQKVGNLTLEEYFGLPAAPSY